MSVTSNAPPRDESAAQAAQLSGFRDLTERVKAAGLMRRRYGFYGAAFGGAAAAMVALWAGVVLLGTSWLQLILAGALGLVLAQLGFLGHEACHRQVFVSARRNEWTGRIVSGLIVGLSYGWWMNKHNRHHGNPNRVGRDPDIDSRVVAFTPDATEHRAGVAGWLARRQAVFFLPLLMFEGVALHASAIGRLLGRQPVQHRTVEIVFVAVRVLGYPAAVFLLLPPGMAAAFIGVQLAVFGVLLGGAFAPNHIGMPIVPRHTRIDFLRRQVLTSRNIRGGLLTRFLMGGLENQVEHHLFPNMPRPNLRKAQAIVRDYCRQHHITYTETSLVQAYRNLLGYLGQVGGRRPDIFSCPLVQQHRV